MKIGIVNDLALATEALRRVLATAPQHQVIWTAANGAEAVKCCAQNRPDLVLMDLVMPVLNGVEATRRIMAESPCAILIVTATVDGNSGAVFDALGAGALDAVNTPTLAGPGQTAGAQALLAKIDMIGRLIGVPNGPSVPVRSRTERARAGSGHWLFAIGTSAGGPAALAELLKDFTPETPAAFVTVPHLDSDFAPGLADWLGRQLSLPVRLARAGDAPQPGVVLLPAREDHLVLTPQGTLVYTAEPIDYVYRPSVDAFFDSVAANWRGDAVGVLLTGMGRDGARGLKKMRDARFLTIAQDRASCAVYGMPKAAVELDAAAQVLPLSRIGPALAALLGGTRAFSS